MRDPVVVNSAAEIPGLPWTGSHLADYRLFRAVGDFILRSTDPAEQKRAMVLVSLYGMGEPCDEPTDHELAQTIVQMRLTREVLDQRRRRLH